MSKLKVNSTPIGELKARPGNARTHDRKQIRKIAQSISRFGFLVPILIDGEGTIICGHARHQAARELGLPSVPTIRVDHLTPGEVRTFVIAENKLASLAGWDRKLLSIEFAELAEIDPELDLTLTGFELDEIELLGDNVGPPATSDPAPAVEIDRSGQPTSSVADLWCIGAHRLLCGDALQAASYQQVLGADRADLVITDPPYNTVINGHVSGLGSVQHREFVMASGELTRREFRQFLETACRHMTAFSRSGSLHYIFMDWRSVGDLLQVGEGVYGPLLNLIVWAKTAGGMGSMYRSRHELVLLFKRGKRPHKNRVQLGASGRYRTNVWDYPGANSFGATRKDDLALHPTVKNLDMIIDALKDASDRHDIVLDPFGGSGTTLIASERCGRRARLIELDPCYCDAIIKRALKEGLEARLNSTGESFEETSRRRELSSSLEGTDVT